MYKCVYFQLKLQVYDSLRQNRASQLTCTIRILRNENLPTWKDPDVEVTINEDHPVLTFVTKIEALDTDPSVSAVPR